MRVFESFARQKLKIDGDNAKEETMFADEEVFFFEDSVKNLVSAKREFNVTGVLVRGRTTKEEAESSGAAERSCDDASHILSVAKITTTKLEPLGMSSLFHRCDY